MVHARPPVRRTRRARRARHRRSPTARAIRSRYTISWLVILICLDAFFLQGMVSAIRLDHDGRTGAGRPAAGPVVPRARPSLPSPPVPSPPLPPPPDPRPPAVRPPAADGSPAPPVTGAGWRTRHYRLPCGVVTVARTRTRLRLISVKARSGWRSRPRRGAGWLVVEFTGAGRPCRLVADWRDHPPTVVAQ